MSCIFYINTLEELIDTLNEGYKVLIATRLENKCVVPHIEGHILLNTTRPEIKEKYYAVIYDDIIQSTDNGTYKISYLVENSIILRPVNVVQLELLINAGEYIFFTMPNLDIKNI